WTPGCRRPGRGGGECWHERHRPSRLRRGPMLDDPRHARRKTMIRSWMAIGGVVLTVVACGGGSDAGAEPGGEMAVDAAGGMEQATGMDLAALQCEPVERMPVEGRASPYDSVAVP